MTAAPPRTWCSPLNVRSDSLPANTHFLCSLLLNIFLNPHNSVRFPERINDGKACNFAGNRISAENRTISTPINDENRTKAVFGNGVIFSIEPLAR